MTSGRFRFLSAMLVWGIAVSAWSPGALAQGDAPSAADMETARTLYQEGKKLQDEGNLPGALEKFKAAHALASTPVTGIYLARTQAALGKLVDARETCLSILRMPVQPDETERSAQARQDASALARELEPRIPSLVVRVDGLDPSVKPTVTIDGHALPPAAVGLVRKVNPGVHEIRVNAPGHHEMTQQVKLAEAENQELVVTLEPLPPGAVPPTPPPGSTPPPGQPPRRGASQGGMSPLAVTGFIIAGSGAAVGTLSGLLAVQKASELDGDCPDNRCPPDSHGDLDNGRMFGTVSTVAFGVAAVGLTVGIVGLATQDDEPEPAPAVSPFVGLGTAGMRGVF